MRSFTIIHTWIIEPTGEKQTLTYTKEKVKC